MIDPISYGDLVRELYKLSDKWMQGKDWERLGQKYDDFCTGFDEAQQEDAIILRRLLLKTGIVQDEE